VLAAPVAADTDIPGFDRSVVDGYAVRSSDTTGAGDAIPAILQCVGRVAMGTSTMKIIVRAGECAYIPTGGVLPNGADAVVMVEYVEEAGDTILIKKPVAHGENILQRDEDFKKGELVFRPGRRITPQAAGVLAACGCAMVPVAKKPVVGIISTGNELVPVTAVPAQGQVRDANASMLAAWLWEYGCTPRLYGIVRDEREAFETVIARALPQCDVVLLSGGSSKDDRDMTAGVIADKGEVLIHGIAIAPGKPAIIGKIGKKPVFGLPGHPASAFVVLIAIVRPLFDKMLGLEKPVLPTVKATLADNIPSQRGREEYVRVRVENGRAMPLFGKSGLLNTLVKSDGLVCIPAGFEGLEKGSQVEVILW
jgi:molybdopterin molybdotransferase